ncbi:MAG: energy-dependent translational throttle protein EttA, partial [Kiritimatiellae bacterium]|nr:energy-dependent translational throttle protein EttA [Kiritimatiellia bacterium]
MAGEYIYNLQQLTKQYDKVTVLDQVQLAFYFGAKIGVIGGNGSGKSSLLRILAGEDKDFIGEVQIAKNIRIGYLPQEPRLDLSQTVAEAVDEGVAKARGILARYDALCDRMGEDLTDEEMDQLNHELGKVQDQIDAHDLWELDHHVELAMDALRLPPADMPIQNISGGERRRVAMCRLLLSNPDALLLDEPTNHLDADSVQWLESYLKSFPGTVVSVTHDRYFLTNVAEWILELDRGRAFPYQGNYEAFLVQKQALQDREAKQATARKKLLDRELEWVRMNASSRHARNLARIKRYEELANQQVDTQESNLTIQIPSGARLGDLVVRARNLGKAYGDTLLMEDVTFDLPRGGIVGIIGGNGAGKTTLFKMILATELPTSGSIEVGPTVVPAHVDQLRDSLNPDHTVYEEISGGEETLDLGGKPMNSRAYCARFNFKGTDQQKK